MYVSTKNVHVLQISVISSIVGGAQASESFTKT